MSTTLALDDPGLERLTERVNEMRADAVLEEQETTARRLTIQRLAGALEGDGLGEAQADECARRFVTRALDHPDREDVEVARAMRVGVRTLERDRQLVERAAQRASPPHEAAA